MSTGLKTTNDSNSVYTLETPDEKKMRIGITAAVIIGFLLVGYFFLPVLIQTIHNWIDFGIEVGKLAIMLAVIGTLFVMRNVLIARWQSAVRKLTRWLIKTDLPGLLEVVVIHRQEMLAKFGVTIKKMDEALRVHVRNMEERKNSMETNLKSAQQYEKQAANMELDEQQRIKANDKKAFLAKEAAEDKKTLEGMEEDRKKMLKSYNFFDRTYSNLQNSTESIVNNINRLREQLKTSTAWKDAAQSAAGLLGVSNIESITIEETRNKIAENESEVMSIMKDNESLLMKMEAQNGIMDDAGQELLEQYSSKADVFAFMKEGNAIAEAGSSAPGAGSMSWLDANQSLLQ